MRTAGKVIKLLDYIVNPIRDIEVFGMFGPGNLGDEAMLVAALENLPSERCTQWLSYQGRPILNSLVRLRRRKHLLVGGGTLIHGGNTGWLDFIEMRALQGTQVSFWGTGIAFLPDQISDSSLPYRRWCKVLSQSREVHLRGPDSVALCMGMGCQADVFGDFSFLLHREDIPIRDHRQRNDKIGINIGNCLGNQELFEDTMVALLKCLSVNYHLAFHVVVATDMEPTLRVIGRIGISKEHFEIEEHYFDPVKFMRSIRNNRAFIGLKLHAAGLAMVAGVPTLMIGYLPKCVDFLAALKWDARILVDLPLDLEVLASRVSQMIESPDSFLVERQIAALSTMQKHALERVFS